MKMKSSDILWDACMAATDLSIGIINPCTCRALGTHFEDPCIRREFNAVRRDYLLVLMYFLKHFL